jgi:hypothetical protein
MTAPLAAPTMIVADCSLTMGSNSRHHQERALVVFATAASR